jgi:hypothetical protein
MHVLAVVAEIRVRAAVARIHFQAPRKVVGMVAFDAEFAGE